MGDTIFVLDKDTSINGKAISKNQGIPFQNNIYTSKFNEDSLIGLRKLILHYNSEMNIPLAEKEIQQKAIKDKLQLYTQSIIDEKPLLYQVGARWRLLQGFLTEASYEFPYIRLTYKPYHIFYVMILGFGIAGILLILCFFRFSFQSIVPVIPLYTIVIHSLVLRFTEGRYFVPAFPFILICAIYAIYWLKNRFSK